MSQYVLPALHSLFIWWFSTGVVLYLDGLPQRTFRWTMLGATAVLGIALYGLASTSGDTTVGGAYAAFTYALLAWSWIEVSFYLGIVTGPRKQACPEGCRGWRHFGHAILASLWHELAILVLAATMFLLTWDQPNQVGTWTFCVLWWMHQSAKLNVFLGVRNLNEEFIPDHLGFLKSFFTKKPMNLLFPVSVTASTVMAVVLFQRALAPSATPFEVAGFMNVGTMMALAILEHWLLVLPLPFAAIWAWGLTSRTPKQKFDVEIVAGFLGVGKTTYLRRSLDLGEPGVRTVVLVNDFGAVGVDASLLAGRGAEVVELSNGCICCSLRKDLGRQLTEIIARWSPQRILIEPSGVADVAALLGVLGKPEIRMLVRNLRVCTIIDAAAFLRDYSRLAAYFEAQTRVAQVVVVNKTDLVSAAELRTVEHTLRILNPTALIVPAAYGALRPGTLDGLPAASGWMDAGGSLDRGDGRPVHATPGHWFHARSPHDHEPHDDDRHEPTALGFTSWSSPLTGTCDPQILQELLDSVAGGAFGQVERVKGVARVGGGWVHFDIAGGRPNMAAFAARDGEEPRVIAIGHRVDSVRLQAAFDACSSNTVA